MTFEQVKEVVSNVTYRHWQFYVGRMDDGAYVQVQFPAADPENNWALTTQHGRKWYVSLHATESEIVQTCLKAVLTALEHEAREQFTYNNRAIFGPHIDVDALIEVCGRKDVRAHVPA